MRLLFLILTSLSAAYAQMTMAASPYAKQCVVGNSGGCSAITIVGDPYSTIGGFSGYADPNVRKDSITARLWFAYSWPRVTSNSSDSPCVAGIDTIDTHLAHSDDGGLTVTYDGVLYPAECVADPVNPGQFNMTSNEVINLLPQTIPGSPDTVFWYGIHSNYYRPNTAGGAQIDESQRWWFAGCLDTGTGPLCLATATNNEFLGAPSNTSGAWPIALDLSSLNSQVTGCTHYFEPFLVLSGSNLLLFLNCQASGGGLIFYAEFSSPNPASVPDWTAAPPAWSYIGGGGNINQRFAGSIDANDLCPAIWTGADCDASTVFITQMDGVRNQAGTLIGNVEIVTLSGGKTAYGCALVVINTLSPPTFKRSGGKIVVQSAIASQDSATDGPGTCTWAPTLKIGMLITHKFTHCVGGSPGCSAHGGEFLYFMGSGTPAVQN